ncbi:MULTISPECIES: DHH family phosphoesterase [unclassified Methanoregula]|uniref:DHH family phosphoesterase n=1 Tax=unclassified Methanoregula TaxID=2649730 RepID=UPI0009D4CE45|nr:MULTISPECIES: DHH family phosphoesterase [unclassified Methanoregula]OPX64125.1 MAG: putative manganese-dependent inorganic pyrophosphatase [Methanoregula sp. PtaB.Bin085]OPY34755.1 MAG: putative manganese-dependent inorganic pyrophosphatase [Methanoregula sp. PtaU1.Bin006]
MAQEAPIGPGPVKYAIFGCGTNGYNIILELAREHERVIVADRDETRVRHLRDQKFEAYQRDITSSDMLAGLPQFDIAFVMTGDGDANLAAVLTIKKRLPSVQVVARSVDPVNGQKLTAAGADSVIYPQEVVARQAVLQVKKQHASRISQRLFSLLAGWEGTLGIITHNNPDPDAIASAVALAEIARAANPKTLATRIFYDGTIGHQENRTFVNLLDIKMEHLTPEALSQCSHLAMVDCPGPGSNNDVPPQTRIDIVIDHHRDGKHPAAGGSFSDIRPGAGSTASILTQYLQELDVPVDKRVATALLYGIRTDTREFRRNVTPQDLGYAGFLLPLTDAGLLDKIMSPSMSQETLDVIGTAITKRRIQSGYLFANVGYVMNRDALPQAADILITLEGVNTALVYGITDTAIVISARNRDVRLHIGNALSEAFGEMGDAGGHPNMAAATLPLHYFGKVEDKARLLEIVIEPVLRKFRDLVGLENEGKKNGSP